MRAGIADSVYQLGYGLEDGGIKVRFPAGITDFSQWHPDQLLGPPNILSNEYPEIFPLNVKLK
jgi:hypothetical protein